MKRRIAFIGLLLALLLIFTGCKQHTNSQLNIQNNTTNSCEEITGNDGKLPTRPECMNEIKNQCDSDNKC